MRKRFLFLTLAAALAGTAAATSFAVAADTVYTDVASTAWYAQAVTYVSGNGLMSGTGNARFSPDEPTNLAMLLSILHRDAGSPAALSAVPTGASSWYAEAVAWAADRGFLADINNNFAGTPITREDLVTVLWRYAGSPAGTSEAFSDASEIASYAAQAVNWSRANAVVSGRPGNRFEPKDSATRAELAIILQNFLTLGQQDASSTEQSPPADGTVKKPLIAYFAYSENIGDTSSMTVDAISSASLNAHTDNETGNLQVMVREIQNKREADVHPILITEPYDPEYEMMRDRADREVESNSHPVLTTKVDNLDQYDTIYLGTPVWFGSLPPAVSAFLSGNDLSGHTIVPIGIHLGSGFGSILQQIEDLCPNATLAEGFTIRANTPNSQVKDEIVQWLADQH